MTKDITAPNHHDTEEEERHMLIKDLSDEIRRLQSEAAETRQTELETNYKKLSPESQVQLVMLSRKLVEKGEEAERRKRFEEAVNKLNAKGLAVLLDYMMALASDPRYRKE